MLTTATTKEIRFKSPKEYHDIAKSEDDRTVRNALIQVLEIISACDARVVNGKNSHEIRAARLDLRAYKMAATALRAAIAKHNKENKKTEQPVFNAATFGLVLKAIQAVSRVPQQTIKTKADSTEPVVIQKHINGNEVLAADPVLAKIADQMKAGKSLEDIATDAKKLEPVAVDIASLFIQTNENGEIEL